MKPRIILILALAALALSACGASGDAQPVQQELVEIRLPMGFVPNVQFAPFYVAVEKGFYRDAGLDVAFDYKRETDGLALVGANEIKFSVVSGEQVPLARAEGLPVVYVMAWYEDFPVAVIAKSGRGITQPEDMEGKVVGLPGLYGANYVGLRALLDQVGLKESDLELKSIGFNQVEVLASDQADAVVGYVTNEPVQLSNQGYEVETISVSDYLPLVSNGLITNQKTIDENPDLVRDMVQATLKGIRYTVENPEEAYEISEKFVEGLKEVDRDVQMEVLTTSIELYQTDPYGESDASAWENMAQVLATMGLIEKDIKLEEAFSNAFIE